MTRTEKSYEEPTNDLFLGAAEYYERCRIPYPADVFSWIVNEPGGGLVVLAPSSIWRGHELWKQVVITTINDWLGEERRAGSGTFKSGPLHEECLAQTPFSEVKTVAIHKAHVWNADSLVGYLYSTSFASKAVLGDAQKRFERGSP